MDSTLLAWVPTILVVAALLSFPLGRRLLRWVGVGIVLCAGAMLALLFASEPDLRD